MNAPEITEAEVEVVTAWLQKRRTIMGRVVMHPVEGGDAVARLLARNLLAALAKESGERP